MTTALPSHLPLTCRPVKGAPPLLLYYVTGMGVPYGFQRRSQPCRSAPHRPQHPTWMKALAWMHLASSTVTLSPLSVAKQVAWSWKWTALRRLERCRALSRLADNTYGSPLPAGCAVSGIPTPPTASEAERLLKRGRKSTAGGSEARQCVVRPKWRRPRGSVRARRSGR